MGNGNKTAIVTGASSGIGLGVTKVLLERGFQVVANSRKISAAGTLTPSERLLLVDGDIAHPEMGAELVEAAVRRFGSLDLLVNNAGIFISKAFTEYTVEDFRSWCPPTWQASSTPRSRQWRRCGASHRAIS